MSGAAGACAPLRVLLVDDDPLARLLASRLLEQQGQKVTQVDGGREALRRAGLESFDVVLLDIHMPDLDGFAAARALRTAGAVGLIVGLTGDQQVVLGQDWHAAGMDACLAKPFEIDPFLKVVRSRGLA
jgi:CheY-like chemotaxis protein